MLDRLLFLTGKTLVHAGLHLCHYANGRMFKRIYWTTPMR